MFTFLGLPWALSEINMKRKMTFYHVPRLAIRLWTFPLNIGQKSVDMDRLITFWMETVLWQREKKKTHLQEDASNGCQLEPGIESLHTMTLIQHGHNIETVFGFNLVIKIN